MKQNTTKKTKVTHVAKPQNRTKGVPAVPAEVIKIGVDVGLYNYAYCRQVDGSKQQPAHLTDPIAFVNFVESQKPLAKRVVVCYEAGFLGFELARKLRDEMKVECIVMAPVKLDEANKGVETDKLNAQDICSRLDRYLAGNHRALTSCRIPTKQEELDRQQTRQRQQLLDERKSLRAQGRSLLWQFGYLSSKSWKNWDEESQWLYLSTQIKEPEVLQGLGRMRAIILEITKQLEELETRLVLQCEQTLPATLKKLPTGMGWLSILILTREIMDWERFNNRRQVSCFSGLVPSECSTGQSYRQGSVTKVGNPVMRAILIEMAWRLVRYQPNCRAVKPWLQILCNKRTGARARKRAIVAVARVLIVDLWRLATGQTTPEKLGFTGC